MTAFMTFHTSRCGSTPRRQGRRGSDGAPPRERRAERDARVVLEQTGVPPGFRHVGTSVRGSVYCSGPCRRVYATSVADMPFLPAIGRITEHLRAKGATKRCDLMLNCQVTLVPEDCRPFNEGPVCRMALVVDGRPLLVSVSEPGSRPSWS